IDLHHDAGGYAVERDVGLFREDIDARRRAQPAGIRNCEEAPIIYRTAESLPLQRNGEIYRGRAGLRPEGGVDISNAHKHNRPEKLCRAKTSIFRVGGRCRESDRVSESEHVTSRADPAVARCERGDGWRYADGESDSLRSGMSRIGNIQTSRINAV